MTKAKAKRKQTAKKAFLASSSKTKTKTKCYEIGRSRSVGLGEYRTNDSTNTKNYASSTPTQFCASPSLEGVPYEVIASIGNYMDRSSQNNTRLASTRLNRILDDPLLVHKPWPTETCPFQKHSIYLNDHHLGPIANIVFSPDASRVAVFRKGKPENNEAVPTPGHMQVWDRTYGLISEWNCSPDIFVQPIFSPNSQVLLYNEGLNDVGIKVCLLPPTDWLRHKEVRQLQRRSAGGGWTFCAPPAFHLLKTKSISSAAFLNDNTVCAMFAYDTKVYTYKLAVNENRTSVDFVPMGVVRTDDRLIPSSEDVLTTCSEMVTTCRAGMNKNLHLMALFYGLWSQSVIIHDLNRGVSVAKPIALDATMILAISFSSDGQMLIVTHENGTASIYDLRNVDMIETDLTPPKSIKLDSTDGKYNYDYISPIPSNSHQNSSTHDTSVQFLFTRDRSDDYDGLEEDDEDEDDEMDGDTPTLCILDVQKEELDSTIWNCHTLWNRLTER